MRFDAATSDWLVKMQLIVSQIIKKKNIYEVTMPDSVVVNQFHYA